MVWTQTDLVMLVAGVRLTADLLYLTADMMADRGSAAGRAVWIWSMTWETPCMCKACRRRWATVVDTVLAPPEDK